MMAFPQPSDGAIFHVAMTSGKFHGVMSAHTPTGSRSDTSRPGPWTGIVSPKILFAAPPQYSNVFATIPISPRAALIGLPAFRLSAAAKVSSRSRNSVEARRSTRPRSVALIRRHAPSSKARTAMFTARFASSAPASATSTIGPPVPGSITSNVEPSAASFRSPARTRSSVAMRCASSRGHDDRHDARRALRVRTYARATMGRLDGKVALITGGASGMGMVASTLFAAEGARVVLTDVADDAGETVAKEIADAGGEAAYVHADVSREADARSMVDAAVERFGALHVLYNNAGVMLADDGSVDSTDESIWDRTLAINVKGVAFGCKFGIPAMVESGGGGVKKAAPFF